MTRNQVGGILLAGALALAAYALLRPQPVPCADGGCVADAPQLHPYDGPYDPLPACAYGYTHNADGACVLAPGFVPVPSGGGVQGAIEAQAAAVDRLRQEQVNASLRQARTAEEARH